MKFSFSLRKLWLFQTLVVFVIGGWFAWQKWSHLFDAEYWEFEAFNEQLSSVPLVIDGWNGTLIDKSRYSKELREHYPPAFSSRVYYDSEVAGEMTAYLVAGNSIKDIVKMHPLIGMTKALRLLNRLVLNSQLPRLQSRCAPTSFGRCQTGNG